VRRCLVLDVTLAWRFVRVGRAGWWRWLVASRARFSCAGSCGCGFEADWPVGAPAAALRLVVAAGACRLLPARVGWLSVRFVLCVRPFHAAVVCRVAAFVCMEGRSSDAFVWCGGACSQCRSGPSCDAFVFACLARVECCPACLLCRCGMSAGSRRRVVGGG